MKSRLYENLLNFNVVSKSGGWSRELWKSVPPQKQQVKQQQLSEPTLSELRKLRACSNQINKAQQRKGEKKLNVSERVSPHFHFSSTVPHTPAWQQPWKQNTTAPVWVLAPEGAETILFSRIMVVDFDLSGCFLKYWLKCLAFVPPYLESPKEEIATLGTFEGKFISHWCLEKGVPLGANRRQIGKWEGKAEMLWGIMVLKRSHKLLEV